MTHLYIEDYYDPIRDRIIPLGRMDKDKAYKKLVIAGIEMEIADAYVTKAWFAALEKFTCDPRTPEEVRARLKNLGYQPSEIRNQIHSTLYDELRMTFPSHYPICALRFSTDMIGEEATLVLEAASVLTLHRLAEELNIIDPPIWALHFYFKEDISAALSELKNIFTKLQQLSIDNEMKMVYQAAHLQCKQFLRKFFFDQEQGFTNGNYYLRYMQPKASARLLPNPSQNTRDLFYAIRKHNVTAVEKLLTAGTDPKLNYRQSNLLGQAIPGYQEKIDTTVVLRIFALLLEHGATIESGMTNGSALGTVIRRAFECDIRSKEYEMYELMIKLLMLIDNGRTYSYLSKNSNLHPLINFIARGQKALAAKKYQRAEMHCLSTNPSQFAGIWMRQPHLQSFIFNNVRLRSVTLPLHHALSIEQDRIYNLFEKAWPHLSKCTLKQSYSETIDANGQGIAELIYEGKNLVGLNIAECLIAKISGKNTLIHHPKLTIFTPTISHNCPGLAFYLLHYRGFLTLEQQLPITTVTIFETASLAGISLALPFEHYPRTQTPELKNYVEAMLRIVYAKNLSKLFPLNDRWYIEDDLAKFDNYVGKDWYLSRTAIALKNLISTQGFFGPKRSNIICYVNNAKNFEIFNTALTQSFNMPNNQQEKRLECKI